MQRRSISIWWPVERNIWRTSYSAFPKFPCPRCTTGRLTLVDNSRQTLEPEYSRRDRSDEFDLGPGSVAERFTCFLECGSKFCGEVVTVCGNVHRESHDEYDELMEEVVTFNNTYYSPSAILPAPSVFSVSKSLSKECTAHIRKAFELLWVDPASCANRIRIFVEYLLDQFQVPRVRASKKGDSYDMNLAQRIEVLEGSKPGHKKTFDALRNVGNYGSHSGNAKFDTLIDCFEILEEVLKDLVDGRRSRLEKITERLSAKGGEF
jgi:hypothetical protein